MVSAQDSKRSWISGMDWGSCVTMDETSVSGLGPWIGGNVSVTGEQPQEVDGSLEASEHTKKLVRTILPSLKGSVEANPLPMMNSSL